MLFGKWLIIYKIKIFVLVIVYEYILRNIRGCIRNIIDFSFIFVVVIVCGDVCVILFKWGILDWY